MPTKSEFLAALREITSSKSRGNIYSSRYDQNLMARALREARKRQLVPKLSPGRVETNLPKGYFLAVLGILEQWAVNDSTGKTMRKFDIDLETLSQLKGWLKTHSTHASKTAGTYPTKSSSPSKT